MIPAEFDYVRAGSVDEAVRALADGGDDAKVLAGGQSLIPLLRLRLSYPEVVVDVGRVEELRGVREDGDHLVIGAMTTHAEVIDDDLVRTHCGLLAEATETVADPAVRHRGTFGGALAHADPAGDLPAVALALDAELVIAGPGGRRTVPAKDFSSTTSRRRSAPTSCWSRCGCPSSARDGVTATRSSTAWPSRGQSLAWPPSYTARTARSTRPASG